MWAPSVLSRLWDAQCSSVRRKDAKRYPLQSPSYAERPMPDARGRLHRPRPCRNDPQKPVLNLSLPLRSTRALRFPGQLRQALSFPSATL